jgi:hypothetical protein
LNLNKRERRRAMEAKYTREKDTKNMVQYLEVVPKNEEPVTRSIYISKAAVKELGDPDNITVTIKASK